MPIYVKDEMRVVVGLDASRLPPWGFADLVIFCEDFLVFAYRIKIFKGFEIGYTDERNRTAERPCKYGLFMVNYTESQ